MSSPNSDQTYANAVKLGDNDSRSSSPVPSTRVTVNKRKRESSSSDSSADSSSSSSSSSEQLSSISSDNNKITINFHSKGFPGQVFQEIMNSPARLQKYMSDLSDKIMHDATTSSNVIATQTEEELLINASIVQNLFVKLRDDRRTRLVYDLEVEREKSKFLSDAISKILEFGVSGLAAAKHETIFKEQRHSLAFSGAIDIKPEARVFDEDFWRPMMMIHKKWDEELESNTVISNKLKLSLSSIVNECRDVTSKLDQRLKTVHPLVIKSHKLCQSLPSNISCLSNSKEARRSRSSRLCNSESPKDEDKVSLSDYSKFKYVQFPKQHYDNSFSTPAKSLAQKLPITAKFGVTPKQIDSSFDQYANDSKYLKARKIRFAQKNNDSPTKTFIEQSSSDSLIEIEIPNVKITIPVNNQSSPLSEKIEFSAEFPNLLEIVEEKINEFRSNVDDINLDNFDISQEEDDYNAEWEKYISSKVKKEASEEE